MWGWLVGLPSRSIDRPQTNQMREGEQGQPQPTAAFPWLAALVLESGYCDFQEIVTQPRSRQVFSRAQHTKLRLRAGNQVQHVGGRGKEVAGEVAMTRCGAMINATRISVELVSVVLGMTHAFHSGTTYVENLEIAPAATGWEHGACEWRTARSPLT